MTPTVIAWRGPSAFDGTTIQVVLTGLVGGSTNEKTGKMVQAYILPADHRGATEALTRGWRYFRIRTPNSLKLPSEVVCPNTTHEVQCHDCRLCSGLRVKARNVVIDAHGPAATSFKQPSLL